MLVAEDRRIRLAAAFLQSGVEDGDGVPAQRNAAFLAPLAATAKIGVGTEANIGAMQGDDL